MAHLNFSDFKFQLDLCSLTGNIKDDDKGRRKLWPIRSQLLFISEIETGEYVFIISGLFHHEELFSLMIKIITDCELDKEINHK